MGTKENIEDLQATSGQIIADAERIRELEEAKRHIDPSSDHFRDLSREVQRAADDVNVLTDAERELADEVADEPGTPTIAEADVGKRGHDGRSDG